MDTKKVSLEEKKNAKQESQIPPVTIFFHLASYCLECFISLLFPDFLIFPLKQRERPGRGAVANFSKPVLTLEAPRIEAYSWTLQSTCFWIQQSFWGWKLLRGTASSERPKGCLCACSFSTAFCTSFLLLQFQSNDPKRPSTPKRDYSKWRPPLGADTDAKRGVIRAKQWYLQDNKGFGVRQIWVQILILPFTELWSSAI